MKALPPLAAMIATYLGPIRTSARGSAVASPNTATDSSPALKASRSTPRRRSVPDAVGMSGPEIRAITRFGAPGPVPSARRTTTAWTWDAVGPLKRDV